MAFHVIEPLLSSRRQGAVVSKRKRTVIVVILIELLLAGGWMWLHNLAVTSPHANADAARVTGQVFGGAMGLILALSPLLYFMARKNDEREAANTRKL